ncbi:MAG: hypothetical protein WCJ17_02630, partial [bacterium]
HDATIMNFDINLQTAAAANDASLLVRWEGQLNRNIEMIATEARDGSTPADTCSVVLQQDLEFKAPYVISANGNGDCTVDCNGYKLIMGGDDSGAASIGHTLTVQNPYLQLSGPVTISDAVNLILSGGYLDGQSNVLTFSDTLASLDNNESYITLKNLVLRNVRAHSLVAHGVWNCLQTRIESSEYDLSIPTKVGDEFFTLAIPHSSFDLTGAITEGGAKFFCGGTAVESDRVVFENSSVGTLELSLNTDLSLYTWWWLSNAPIIKGNGHSITFKSVSAQLPEVEGLSVVRSGACIFGGGSLRFEDITLEHILPSSINTWNGNVLFVSDVHWCDAQGNNIFITGLTESAAEIQLPGESDTAGDLFNNNITFLNGVHIELLGDCALSSSWVFQEDSVIDGRGATFDLEGAVFKIAPFTTLTLRNIVLKNVSAGLFQHTIDFNGAARLSSVVMELVESAMWTKDIRVEGPLTIITGEHTLHAFNIEVGTALYDTLGTEDIGNVTVWAGQIRPISASVGGGSDYNPHTTGTITINGNASLDKNEYLFPSDEIDGRDIVCTGSGVYNGHGRTIFFPYSEGFAPGSATVLTVQSGQTLVTNNMIIDGLVPTQHLSTVGGLYFGHDTLVRLNQDVTLDAVLRFGSNDEESSEENMVLDLQGHTLDLGTGWIQLYGGGSDGNVLTIRNGRILVRDSDLLTVAAGNTLVLEDVEIVLMSTNWLHDNGNLRFEGHCRISGDFGNTVIFTSAGSMYIGETATLTLCDGIVWSQSANHRFYFASPTATLELIGATLRHPDSVYNADAELVDAGQLFVSYGRLIIDHTSSIQPGLGGIYLVDNLDIEFRPGAILTVGINDVESSQHTSAGTLVYGAD